MLTMQSIAIPERQLDSSDPSAEKEVNVVVGDDDKSKVRSYKRAPLQLDAMRR